MFSLTKFNNLASHDSFGTFTPGSGFLSELSLCPPVHFEVRRGLLWKNAQVQWNAYTQDIVPRFTWIPLLEADWEQAAVLWAQTRKAGRQLSDIDLLIAAITLRVEGTIASNDADFDALDVPRVNWHNAP